MQIQSTLAFLALSLTLPTLPTTLTQCEDPPEYGPDVPLAACDMAPYSLVPREEVGMLVDWEELPAFNLSPEAVDALLAEMDFTYLSPVPYGSRVFRYRYTTQDKGVPVEATGLLGIPANAELPPDPFATAAYLHGTTGFSDPCAPSSTMPDGPAETALVAALGFVTVAPDYIGLMGMGEPSTAKHGYVVGEQIAIGSWDAVRAGRELLEQHVRASDVTIDDRVVLWGGSQGGHGVLFTELYGPYYAPEYDVQAVVAMVPPTTLPPLVEYAMGTFSDPTVSLTAIATTMREWYAMPEDLYGIFTNEDPYYLADNAESYVYVEEECNPGDGLDADEVTDIFVQPFIDAVLEGRWEDIQPWTCFFEENSLATSSVPALRYTPTLMTYSEEDELVVTETQVEDFDRLCGMGYQLEYLECAGASHTEGALWSLPSQLDWIKARLAGEAIPEEVLCQRQEPVCCPASPEDVCTQ